MGLINAWKGLFTAGEPNPTVIPTPKKRMFQGAAVSRLTAGWVADGTSADAEIKGSIKRLRQRARQLVRDNAYARQAVRSIVANVIGPNGIKLQGQVKMVRGKKLDPKINEAIEQAWKKWGRGDSCNTAGRLSFVDIERLVTQSLVESGEVFIRIVRKPFGRSSIPIALEILESDQLDDEFVGPSTKSKKNTWRMGVLVDEWMRPIQYAFLTKHPGDTTFGVQPNTKRHMFLPAKDIIHLYMQDRPSQTRGTSWLASVIQPLHHLAGFEESSVIRARASSALMGFIQSGDGELDAGGEVYEEERVTQFEPGVFKYLNQNESVTIPDMDSPNGEFPEFMRSMLRGVAAGIGVSFESVSRDFSQTNYSSSRLSLLEDRAQYRHIQNYLVENFHNRIFDAWIEMAVLSGNLDLPTYETEPDRYRNIRWVPRGWAWIDPQKEIAAAKEAVKAGFKTQSEIIAEQGGDIEELLPIRKAEVEKAEQLGLVFDTDASTSTQPQQASNMNENNNPETNGGKT